METYVILAKPTEKGRQDIHGIAERRQKNIEDLKQNGINVVADYALMGDYDFLYVVEAPDNRTIMEQIVKNSRAGTLVFHTMAALPLDQFAGIARNTRHT
ncbi:MAG TPA: GYD domain-containing protein [Herpetosiphonaceae bacterium]